MALSEKQRRARTQAPEMHLAVEDGTQQIPVDRIQTDGGTQMRAGLDDSTVEDYARAIADGVQLPAIEVYYDGEVYWLADGFHRVAAHRRECDRNEIDYGCIAARVHSGTRRDTILHAAGANHAHGLRRTNADIERAVTTLLRDEEWRGWTNAEIARVCHVDPKTVGNYRRRLETTREIPESSSRRTSSGRTINTSNIGGRRESGQTTEVYTGSAGGSDDETEESEGANQAPGRAGSSQSSTLPDGWRIIERRPGQMVAIRSAPWTPVATVPIKATNAVDLLELIEGGNYNTFWLVRYGLERHAAYEITLVEFEHALTYLAREQPSELANIRSNLPPAVAGHRKEMLDEHLQRLMHGNDGEAAEESPPDEETQQSVGSEAGDPSERSEESDELPDGWRLTQLPDGRLYAEKGLAQLATAAGFSKAEVRGYIDRKAYGQEFYHAWWDFRSLHSIPPHDSNFKGSLESASNHMIGLVLDLVKDQKGHKVRVEALQRELRRREKQESEDRATDWGEEQETVDAAARERESELRRLRDLYAQARTGLSRYTELTGRYTDRGNLERPLARVIEVLDGELAPFESTEVTDE